MATPRDFVLFEQKYEIMWCIPLWCICRVSGPSLSDSWPTKTNVSKWLIWQSKHKITKLEHGHENRTFFSFLLTLTLFARFPFTRSHIHSHSALVFVVTSAQGLYAPRISHGPTVHVNYKTGAWGFCPSAAGKYNGTKQWVKWKKEREENKQRNVQHSYEVSGWKIIYQTVKTARQQIFQGLTYYLHAT